MVETTTVSRPELLVPMHLDALVINKPVTAQGTYNRWRMDYSQMNELESPKVPPFDNQNLDPPEPGVHLHWALPEGLRHGVENDKGEIEFPFVPNRWLVIRIQPAGVQAGASRTAAWVVLSDELGPKCSSPYIDPDPQKSKPGQVSVTRLGSRRTLEEWDKMQGENGMAPRPPFLTAIGPGNVTFAAFAPGVENVFAFYDDLKGVQPAKLTYLVLGWYSQPGTMDPLMLLPADDWKGVFLFNISPNFQAALESGHVSDQLRQVFKDYGLELAGIARVQTLQQGSQWQIVAGDRRYTARLENVSVYIYDTQFITAGHLKWTVEPGGSPPPKQTIVHGMVYGVDWNPTANLPEPPNYPKPIHTRVHVAVGNTSEDALAALVLEQAQKAGVGPVLDRLLESLKNALLPNHEETAGKIQLDQQIRPEWFGSEAGGIRWTIAAREREREGSQTVQKPPTITRLQAEWLADLNRNQRMLDAQRRLLASLQEELYSLWWKSKRIIKNAPKPRSKDRQDAVRNAAIQLPKHLDKNVPTSLLKSVIELQTSIATLEKSLPVAAGPGSADSIAAYCHGHLNPEELELKPVAMARFWHPTDPVIVISGLGGSEKLSYDGNLLCRLLSQTITGIALPGQPGITVKKLERLIPQLSSQNIPPCTNQLLKEAFFLDPGNADLAAQAGLKTSAGPDALVKAFQDIKQIVPDGMNQVGNYGALEWKQPWVPLFVDWQARFYYTSKKNADGSYRFDQEDWHFDGTGYAWTGAQVSTLNLEPLSYSGRTFLTPQSTIPFINRLQEYAGSHTGEDTGVVEKILKKVSEGGILSQTMSGFTSQLVMQDVESNVMPDETIAPYVEANCDRIPLENIVPTVDVKPGTESPFFFPLRAGFFRFQNLRIIDSFGRVLDLMKANENPRGNEVSFKPIHGRGMALDSESDRSMVLLPPRIVQSSRLSFQFVSVEKSQQEIDLAADANPVCGWLLPNHINNSIAAYDTSGNLLGELIYLEKTKGKWTAAWYPAPGSGEVQAASGKQPVKIPNQHMQKMIQAFINRNDQGAAFDTLLQVIDKTLWTSDPLGERGDKNLSVLIGRPLALVRANLQLELNGSPYYNQAWHETFKPGSFDLKKNSGGLLDLAFPIRLGSPDLRNNGLIGYFQGDDYSQFHAVQLPEGFTPANPPYIHQIGENDDYIKLKFLNTEEASIDPTRSIYLTLIIDPRGAVQAECGLLPSKIVDLPQAYFEKPLRRMAVTFRIGPLLLDPQTIRIPQPAGRRGKWTWIQAQAAGTGRVEWKEVAVEMSDTKGRLTGSTPVLREGWLKFTPEDIDE